MFDVVVVVSVNRSTAPQVSLVESEFVVSWKQLQKH